MSDLDRIRWQCRRGMLELDLVLNRFVEEDLAALDAAGQAAFKALLAEHDTQLLAWIMGQEQAPPPYGPLIARMRKA